jgi:ABC-2 type transport system ATP-binding protein
MAFIEIKNLSKNFPKEKTPALSNINAVIGKGKIVGLVGPDGAGKTTLIRLMAGLLLPTEGEILIDGLNTVKDAEKIHQIIGYMPQKFGLYEDLTVLQNLNLYADLRQVIGEERQKKFEQLLNFSGLNQFQDRLAGNLSGGMKQKLGLACALIKKPKLLLLDEASVGVDPVSRRELWKMVHQLIEEGVSIIWSTSYLDEAEKCSSVLLLNEGKLLFNGNPEELTSRVKGQTFLITHITSRKRIVLVKALAEDDVLDGVIQGDNVRIVLKDKNSASFNLKKTDAGVESDLIPVAPRFEDAFISALGGGPGGESNLAAQAKAIENTGKNVVEAIGLTKKFGSFIAASDITFNIAQGEIFGLLGPNGAGKSTTFKMLCGLLTPTSGEAFVEGIDLQKAPSEARAQIGYMAQKFSLYGDLSVMQNLQFFSGIYNLQGQEKNSMIQKMIETFSFQSYLDVSAGMLPLGFKQRLALACSTMHSPKVLFLDEPTSGVDPITRREFWNHINGLVEKNITVLVTTHFMDEAEYCDRIGLVYRGKMIRMGSPDQLKMLVKSENKPNPTLEDAFIELIERYDADANGAQAR